MPSVSSNNLPSQPHLGQTAADLEHKSIPMSRLLHFHKQMVDERNEETRRRLATERSERMQHRKLFFPLEHEKEKKWESTLKTGSTYFGGGERGGAGGRSVLETGTGGSHLNVHGSISGAGGVGGGAAGEGLLAAATAQKPKRFRLPEGDEYHRVTVLNVSEALQQQFLSEMHRSLAGNDARESSNSIGTTVSPKCESSSQNQNMPSTIAATTKIPFSPLAIARQKMADEKLRKQQQQLQQLQHQNSGTLNSTSKLSRTTSHAGTTMNSNSGEEISSDDDDDDDSDVSSEFLGSSGDDSDNDHEKQENEKRSSSSAAGAAKHRKKSSNDRKVEKSNENGGHSPRRHHNHRKKQLASLSRSDSGSSPLNRSDSKSSLSGATTQSFRLRKQATALATTATTTTIATISTATAAKLTRLSSSASLNQVNVTDLIYPSKRLKRLSPPQNGSSAPINSSREKSSAVENASDSRDIVVFSLSNFDMFGISNSNSNSQARVLSSAQLHEIKKKQMTLQASSSFRRKSYVPATTATALPTLEKTRKELKRNENMDFVLEQDPASSSGFSYSPSKHQQATKNKNNNNSNNNNNKSGLETSESSPLQTRELEPPPASSPSKLSRKKSVVLREPHEEAAALRQDQQKRKNNKGSSPLQLPRRKHYRHSPSQDSDLDNGGDDEDDDDDAGNGEGGNGACGAGVDDDGGWTPSGVVQHLRLHRVKQVNSMSPKREKGLLRPPALRLLDGDDSPRATTIAPATASQANISPSASGKLPAIVSSTARRRMSTAGNTSVPHPPPPAPRVTSPSSASSAAKKRQPTEQQRKQLSHAGTINSGPVSASTASFLRNVSAANGNGGGLSFVRDNNESNVKNAQSISNNPLQQSPQRHHKMLLVPHLTPLLIRQAESDFMMLSYGKAFIPREVFLERGPEFTFDFGGGRQIPFSDFLEEMTRNASSQSDTDNHQSASSSPTLLANINSSIAASGSATTATSSRKYLRDFMPFLSFIHVVHPLWNKKELPSAIRLYAHRISWAVDLAPDEAEQVEMLWKKTDPIVDLKTGKQYLDFERFASIFDKSYHQYRSSQQQQQQQQSGKNIGNDNNINNKAGGRNLAQAGKKGTNKKSTPATPTTTTAAASNGVVDLNQLFFAADENQDGLISKREFAHAITRGPGDKKKRDMLYLGTVSAGAEKSPHSQPASANSSPRHNTHLPSSMASNSGNQKSLGTASGRHQSTDPALSHHHHHYQHDEKNKDRPHSRDHLGATLHSRPSKNPSQGDITIDLNFYASVNPSLAGADSFFSNNNNNNNSSGNVASPRSKNLLAP